MEQETLEEAAERLFPKEKHPTSFETLRRAFISNAVRQQRQQETLEEAAEKVAKSKAFEFKVDYKPFETDLDYREYAEYGFKKGFLEGAEWQQEQNNKELAKWKLAVEKQEARCIALRGVISDLQERMYSEEDMIEFAKYCNLKDDLSVRELLVIWFEQFKKNRVN